MYIQLVKVLLILLRVNNMKYFNKSEFVCKCCGQGEISQELMNKLDKAREIAGVPFKITSGYRCEAHNHYIGGKNGSSHTKGLAVDIACEYSPPRYKIMEALGKVGINRIGMAEDFIHCDIDKDKAQNVIWVY